MNITLELLKELSACEKGIRWFKDFKNPDAEAVVKQLMVENRFEWANWLIPRLFDNRNLCILYALSCASMVVDSVVLRSIERELGHDDLQHISDTAYSASWVPWYGSISACVLWCASQSELRYCAPWATHAGTNVYNRDESLKTPIINYGLELLNDNTR